MAVFYPRHFATLTCPIFGTTARKQQQIHDANAVTIDMRLIRSRLGRNHHNMADELELTVDWRTAGIDPRMLTSARVQFYAGDTRSLGPWQPTRENLRFVGVMTHPTRRAGGESPMTVEMKFLDYTDFFLKQKPFPPEGLPKLTDDLRTAWRKICEKVGFYDLKSQSIVSSVDDLKDALLFVGDAALADGVELGQATSARFRNTGANVQMKPGSDAWGVWNQCVGMLGLVTFFRLDRIVIASAVDYYTADDPPILSWGDNILDWTETSGGDRAHKGVGLSSFDPLSQTVLEAFYPPPGDPRITMKRTPAASKKKGTNDDRALQSENYEMFADDRGITDPAKLLDEARRIFEEYARHQVEGEASTRKMMLRASSDPTRGIDPYDLNGGDSIRIEFDSDTLREAAQFDSLTTQVEFLMGRGYREGVAKLIAQNLESFRGLPPIFHIKSLFVELDTSSDPGNFIVSIHYVNLVNPFGAADSNDGPTASTSAIARADGNTPRHIEFSEVGVDQSAGRSGSERNR